MAGPAAAAAVAGRIAGVTFGDRKSLLWLLILVFGIPLAFIAVLVAIFGGFVATLGWLFGVSAAAPTGIPTYVPSKLALRDIPPAYLLRYQEAGVAYGIGWEYLAAIGKIETEHGRSNAPGVKSGTNDSAFASGKGCCAGPMQFYILGAGGGTWGAYGVDGNKDGKKDVYDPDDAIPAAAAYLKASGAPKDWDRALWAYNHSTKYVADVKRQAGLYRGAPLDAAGLPVGSDQSQALPIGATWLAPVPGTTATCDRRIVPDVAFLLQRYKMRAGDCFAMTGHDIDGEHPLGVGIDLYAGPGGSWDLVDKAARDLGWKDSCGATGCAGQLPSPFRFAGWNGYPNHGDPAHAGDNAHLHLSWQHTPSLPGNPAARVQTLLPSTGAPTTLLGPDPAPPRPVKALLNFGDSLAEGTDKPLTDALDGWQVLTDASTGRTSTDGVKRLTDLAGTLQLPPVLAISLGTNNEPTSAPAFARAITDVMTVAGGDRCVLWLSIKRPAVKGVTYAALNRELRDAAQENRNLKIVNGAAGQSAPDAIHKTPAGYAERADLIARAARRCLP